MKVATTKVFQRIENISDAVFTDGNTYILQVKQGACEVYASASEPQEGFLVRDFEKFEFTKESGESLWIRGHFPTINNVELVISGQ